MATTQPNTKTLKTPTFSKGILLVFILVFAGIGGYALYKSFAAGTTANIWVSAKGSDSGANCKRFITPASNPDSGGTTLCATLNKALGLASDGDTIQITDGELPSQSISGVNFSNTVNINGDQAAVINGLSISGSSNIKISGVSFSPPSGSALTAQVHVASASHDITFDSVNMDGLNGSAGFGFNSDTDTSNITVQYSTINQCGHNNKCFGFGASNFRLIKNDFENCEQCTWLKGSGNGATISGNHFGPIYIAPGCTSLTCTHLDMLFIMGSGPWTITDNTWQDCGHGPYGDGDCTAQIFMNTVGTNAIHDVYIASNIFEGHTNSSIRLHGGTAPLPTNITVVNNTAVANGTAIYLDPATWGGQPSNLLPIVANNIEGSIPGGVCTYSQHYNNLVISGTACPADTHGNQDVMGDPNLDANNSPTVSSTTVIDKANALYAPATDYFGNSRVGVPDIGAIEFGGGSTSPKTGDINNDGRVDVVDLSILLSEYGSNKTIADINKDGIVDRSDLTILIANFGT